MKTFQIKIIILYLTLIMCTEIAFSQAIQIPIKVFFDGTTDTTRDSTTLYFGYDPAATYCFDSAFETPGYPYAEPPFGDARWQDPRGENDTCMGSLGLIPKDIRQLHPNLAADTFEIDLIPFDRTSKYKLSWQSGLDRYFDQLELYDINFNKISDMLLDTIKFVNNNRGMATSVFIITDMIIIDDDVKEGNVFPVVFKLKQNFPNPFNPNTTIGFDIPKASIVTLKVFNLLGQEVATLVNEKREAGNYQVEFDGSKLTSGVYYYRLQAGSFIETKKFILIR
jgi:hypothetical protein